MGDSLTIHDWVKSTINTDYAKRMAMSVKEQTEQDQHFNAHTSLHKPDAGFLSFAKGVDIAKKAMIVDAHKNFYGDVKRDMESFLGLSGFAPHEVEQYEKDYEGVPQDYKEAHQLITAVMEAEIGFYRLSAEEYKALQEKRAPEFHIPAKYTKILGARPPLAELKKTSFSEFKTIVQNVRAEMGLPVELLLATAKETAVINQPAAPEILSTGNPEIPTAVITDAAATQEPGSQKDVKFVIHNSEAGEQTVRTFTTVDADILEMLGVNLTKALGRSPGNFFLRKAMELYNDLGMEQKDAGKLDQKDADKSGSSSIGA